MITIQDVNKSRPVLILYSSGTGGEFITSTLSKVSNSFNHVNWIINENVNTTHLTCVLDYGTIWDDAEDPSTWFCNRNLDDLIGDRRYLFRDHPSEYYARLYNKYLPDMQVMNLTLRDNYDYYAKLTFAKLSKKVLVSEFTFDYAFNNISANIDLSLFNEIHKWASDYHWIWEHELNIVHNKIKCNESIEYYDHMDSLESHVASQEVAIREQSNILSDQLSFVFNNYVEIDITDITSSHSMWNQIKDVIPDINLHEAVTLTDEWQTKNRNLLNNGL